MLVIQKSFFKFLTIDLAKPAYICGALTELPKEIRKKLEPMYRELADVCEKVLGMRAFVPHEHFGPIKHANYTPAEVDRNERRQVTRCTSLLIVVTEEPSWGGGIEVEMANQADIPIVLLCPRDKLEAKKVSRLVRGNPGIIHEASYVSLKQVPEILRESLIHIKEMAEEID